MYVFACIELHVWLQIKSSVPEQVSINAVLSHFENRREYAQPGQLFWASMVGGDKTVESPGLLDWCPEGGLTITKLTRWPGGRSSITTAPWDHVTLHPTTLY